MIIDRVQQASNKREITIWHEVTMTIIELMNRTIACQLPIANHQRYDKRISYNHEASINSNQLALETIRYSIINR